MKKSTKSRDALTWLIFIQVERRLDLRKLIFILGKRPPRHTFECGGGHGKYYMVVLRVSQPITLRDFSQVKKGFTPKEFIPNDFPRQLLELPGAVWFSIHQDYAGLDGIEPAA